MTTYYGDYSAGSAVQMVWDSFASTGASVTASGFTAADILIYRTTNTTPRSSSSGITVYPDWAGKVGLHLVDIGTWDSTDIGFFASGNEYEVAVSDVTIDGQTVRFWLGTFSIERNNGVLWMFKNTLVNLQSTVPAIGRCNVASATTTSITPSSFTPAGVTVDQLKGRIVLFDIYTLSPGLRGCARLITASTIATLPVLTVDALPMTPAAGDSFSII